jgi:hypothetical protein
MKKVTKAQKSNRMKKLMGKAKLIHKSHPGMKWTSCVKKAAKKK